MDILPNDILLVIFCKYLKDPLDIISASAVCRSWRIAGTNNQIWKEFYSNQFFNSFNRLKLNHSENLENSENNDTTTTTTSTTTNSSDGYIYSLFSDRCKSESKWKQNENGGKKIEIQQAHLQHIEGIQCDYQNSTQPKFIYTCSRDWFIRKWDMKKLNVFSENLSENNRIIEDDDEESKNNKNKINPIEICEWSSINDHSSISSLHLLNQDTLLSGSASNQVSVIDTTKGTLICSLEGHKDTVFCLESTSDKRNFVSGSWDASIIIWGTEKMEFLKQIKCHNEAVISLQWDSLGHLVTASWDSTIKLWDLNYGTCISKFVSPNHSRIVCSRTQEQSVYFSDNDRSGVMVWDTRQSSTLISNTFCQTTQPNCFDLYDKRLVVCDHDGSINLFETRFDRQIKSLSKDYDELRIGNSINMTEKYLLIGDSLGTLYLWDFS